MNQLFANTHNKRNLIVGLKYYFYLEQIAKVQQSLDGEYFEINIRPIT